MTHAAPRQLERVRLYHQVRSAHLERAAQLPAATIVYGDRRYDFDDSLSAGLDLVHARGLHAAWFMLRHQIDVLEINEPLFIHAARSTALALVGLRLRRLAGRPRTRVVSYSIENLDPRATPVPSGLKHRVARRVDLALVGYIWSRLDRIAYGTGAARTLYSGIFRTRRAPEATLIPALPTPLRGVGSPPKQAGRVLFLGALSDRKGVRQLIRAWPEVVAQMPEARLTVIGKGSLQPEVEDFAARDSTVDLFLDPPREQIHSRLDRSQVLVLPSQPQPAWREQVGLPIVEGLAYGCTVVTTSQTGLADWLRSHGHQVVDEPGSVPALVTALLTALREPLPTEQVLASLPDRDARLAADDWLFGPTGRPGATSPVGAGSGAGHG